MVRIIVLKDSMSRFSANSFIMFTDSGLSKSKLFGSFWGIFFMGGNWGYGEILEKD